jgi:RNA polymerase sigma factor (sigma-70 family)
VSDAVLAALEKFDANVPNENFAGFLFKITSRLWKRRRYRANFFVSYDEQEASKIVDTNSRTDEGAEIAIIMEVLNTLPAKMKETVVLFDVSDLSLEEIRKIQGGTISGVKSRLKRGREMLQKHLGMKNEVVVTPSGTLSVPIRKLSKAGEDYALE